MKPGFWCECHTATGFSRTFSASFDAYSPDQAVRWIRVAVRTIASALDDESAGQAWQWLLTDHIHAVHELSLGHSYALTLKHRSTALTWTARPVLFVPLAHRNGRQLPPCAERFATTPHYGGRD